MKEIPIYIIIFTITNLFIYYYYTCVDINTKIYLLVFYGVCLVYLIYLLISYKKRLSTDGSNLPIIIDLSKNPEYTSNSSKVIYWTNDFNVNGMVDIVDGKATIYINKETSLKYRIIDINEKLSAVYSR